MSTKIYNARRLKPGVKLWPFVASVQKRGERSIKKELTAWYLRMLREATTLAGNSKRHKDLLASLGLPPKHAGPVNAFHLSDFITRQFKLQSVCSNSDFFGMDVSVGFHEHHGRVYLLPIANGMMARTLDFLHTDKSSEDFHYQNQCDKSAKCSDAAWERRGETWEAMMTPGGQLTNGLVLELLTPSNFFLLDYEVREALPKKESKR